MGYVYLIEDLDKESYKIGVTRNIKHRISRLQNGNSSKLDILEVIESEYPYRLEKMLHLHFRNKKIMNEWYNLSKEEARNFRNTCNMLNERIKSLLDNPFFNKNIK